jgi:hypothetical protein
LTNANGGEPELQEWQELMAQKAAESTAAAHNPTAVAIAITTTTATTVAVVFGLKHPTLSLACLLCC